MNESNDDLRKAQLVKNDAKEQELSYCMDPASSGHHVMLSADNHISQRASLGSI